MTRLYGKMGQGLASAFLQSPVLTAGPTMRRGPSPGVWSPDGQYIAFYWARDGINQLWVLPSTGGWPMQLTDDDYDINVEMNTLYDRRLTARPDWSPDGRQIVFSARYCNDKYSSLWTISLDGGEPQRLTRHTGSDRTPSWSPDGKRIAFVCLRDNVDDIWVVSVDGGDPLQLTYTRYNDVDPHWSPDGSKIIFSSQQSEDLFCQEICMIATTGGEVTLLTKDQKVSDRYPRWAPDGKRILFLSDRSGFDEIWSMNLIGDDAQQLTPHTGQDKGEFSISPDGKWLAYESIRRCNIDISLISLVENSIKQISIGDGENTVPSWSPDGKLLLFAHSSPTDATDLWISSFPKKELFQLTQTMMGFLDKVELIEPEQVNFSGFGNENIDALLYRPRTIQPGKQYPAMLLIHGGPNAQHLNTWWPFLQYLVSKGYIVLAPNCHGSMGYGRMFTDSNVMDWAGKDKEDWVQAVKFLTNLDYIDPDRIGIWGRSYGGYATVMGMTHLPELFRTGICHFGPTNLASFWDQTSVRYLMKRFMGLPIENLELYNERSAVPYVDSVQGPLLILQGDADDGVPPSQSEEMIAALEKAGKVYEYYCYEGEGHGFLKPENVLDAANRIESFLEKYLKG
ncbi:MAG: S9 family peptidase [Anaerolineaceae bacterium]|nr:S9 family peptidase [Anaerolineaceae bacterium]